MKAKPGCPFVTRGSPGRSRVWVLLAVAVGGLVVHAMLRDRAQNRRLDRERREEWLRAEEQKELFGDETRAAIFAVNGPVTAAKIHVEGRGDCGIGKRDAPDSEELMWGHGSAAVITVPAEGHEEVILRMRERDEVALVVTRGDAVERYERVKPGVYLLLLDHLDDCVGYESLTYSYPHMVLPVAKAPPPCICMKGLYLLDEEHARTLYSFDEKPPEEIPSMSLGTQVIVHGFKFSRRPRDH
ncbi:hypothetical protein JXA88_06410 [Candidatus Fermentibacteria bacterium]|nr:hypothetical protein [Candidatus Fermentibacteria bacterium]